MVWHEKCCHATSSPPLGVMRWRDNTFRDVLVETCHRAHLGVLVEAGNALTTDHSHTHPADLLLSNWATGKTAAFDTSVTSLLNALTLDGSGKCPGEHTTSLVRGMRHHWPCVSSLQ